MSFPKWYEANKRRWWQSFPWLRDELREAYLAGSNSGKRKKKERSNV